jgi:hypothetical protein
MLLEGRGKDMLARAITGGAKVHVWAAFRKSDGFKRICAWVGNWPGRQAWVFISVVWVVDV